MQFRPYDRCWSTPLAAEIDRVQTLRNDAGKTDRGAMERVRAADAMHHHLDGFLNDISTLVQSGGIGHLPPVTYEGQEFPAYRYLATEAYAAVFMPLQDNTVLALLFTVRPAFVAAETVWAASLFMADHGK